MAEKSVETKDTKVCNHVTQGHKIKGIGLSLSELLKHNGLDDVMIMLKDFSKKIKIVDR